MSFSGQAHEGNPILFTSSSGSEVPTFFFYLKKNKLISFAFVGIVWLILQYLRCRIYSFLTLKQLVIWQVGLGQIVSKYQELLEMISIWYCGMFFRLIHCLSYPSFRSLPNHSVIYFPFSFVLFQGTGAMIYLLVLSRPLGLCVLVICSTLAAIMLLYGR